MILNVSRTKNWFTCRRKYYNNYVLNIQGPRKSMNLVDGSAVHAGIAKGISSKDWDLAVFEAQEKFNAETAELTILPEESYLLEQHWDITVKILEVFRGKFKDENYIVLQPECEFDVEIPNSEHNDITLHWISSDDGVDHWGPPPADYVERSLVRSPHDIVDHGCRCYQAHRLKGKTDAIVLWNNNIWLLEHKTTAITGQQFWSQWHLDIQPTAYIYGIWKSLNIRPSGFILNALIKPSESQVASWNSRRKYGAPKNVSDYIAYEREPFLRTEEDLNRFEKQFIAVCDDIERAMVQGKDAFYMSPVVGACTAYNRLCDYYQLCTTHDDPAMLESMEKRAPDYVDEARDKLVILSEPPKEVTGGTE